MEYFPLFPIVVVLLYIPSLFNSSTGILWSLMYSSNPVNASLGVAAPSLMNGVLLTIASHLYPSGEWRLTTMTIIPSCSIRASGTKLPWRVGSITMLDSSSSNTRRYSPSSLLLIFPILPCNVIQLTLNVMSLSSSFNRSLYFKTTSILMMFLLLLNSPIFLVSPVIPTWLRYPLPTNLLSFSFSRYSFIASPGVLA